MKVIPKFEIKIVPMSNAIKEYIKHKSGEYPDYDEVQFITEWKGGQIFNIRDHSICGYVGNPILVLQKENNVSEIDYYSDEADEIHEKFVKENNITEDSFEIIDDEEEETDAEQE
ncbi:MAG: hypothetical protein J6Z08_06425 [Elusimicrobiales bacterium]|nr:hypothetical protein [Elusimicrobiales bacterium]